MYGLGFVRLEIGFILRALVCTFIVYWSGKEKLIDGIYRKPNRKYYEIVCVYAFGIFSLLDAGYLD